MNSCCGTKGWAAPIGCSVPGLEARGQVDQLELVGLRAAQHGGRLAVEAIELIGAVRRE